MPIKYILDPSGKIIQINSSNEVNEPDLVEERKAVIASQIQTNAIKGYEEKIGAPDGSYLKLGGNILPLSGLLSGGVNLVTGGPENGSGLNVIDAQSAIFEKDKDDVESLFPNNEFGKLVNGSFGFDKDTPIYHYTSFNNYNSDSIKSSIFADELEILAGYDLNSAGFASFKGVDLTTLAFASQFLLQSVAYIFIAKSLRNNSSRSALGNLYTFFDEFVGLRFIDASRDLDELIVDFIRGLDAFINTDPKIPLLMDKIQISGDGSFTAIFQHFLRTLLSLSKQGKNRLHMLIRKFQMQTYWHTEILYKAKSGEGLINTVSGSEGLSTENSLDKFVVEFYRYYFKFIIERIAVAQAGSVSYESLNFDGQSEKATDAKGSSYKEFPNNFRDDYLTKVNRYHASKYRNPSINNSISTLKSIGEYYGQESKVKENLSEDGSGVLGGTNISEGVISIESGYDSDLYIHNYEEDVDKSDLSVSTLPQLIKYDYELVTSKYQDFREYAVKGGASKNKRFSKKLQKQLEEIFNAEMAPLYFHDLRTNEMLSFHAFIDNMSDSFQPQYNPITGYGRIDDVQHYTKTSRSISLSFSLYTMNEEDFATMWQQINKLVTLVYPQWSSGLPSNTSFKDITGFRFPFTQVPTASPLIRLKVGDLIRSNYTEYDMKKLYADPKVYRNGIRISKIDKTETRNRKITKTPEKKEVLYKIFLRPAGAKGHREQTAIRVLQDIGAFENKISFFSDNRHRMLNVYKYLTSKNLNAFKSLVFPQTSKNIAVVTDMFAKGSKSDSIKVKLENDMNKNYVVVKLEERAFSTKKIKSIKPSTSQYGSRFIVKTEKTEQFKYSKPVMLGNNQNGMMSLLAAGRVVETSRNLSDIMGKENILIYLAKVGKVQKLIRTKTFKDKTSIEPNTENKSKDIDQQGNIRSKIDKIFPAMSDKQVNNPYQKAFETSEGLGLAGFITSLGIDTNNQQWETTDVDMRFDDPVSLPMGAKITIQFAPIHDIPPGIDANGVNRAEVYKDVIVEMKERESNS